MTLLGMIFTKSQNAMALGFNFECFLTILTTLVLLDRKNSGADAMTPGHRISSSVAHSMCRMIDSEDTWRQWKALNQTPLVVYPTPWVEEHQTFFQRKSDTNCESDSPCPPHFMTENIVAVEKPETNPEKRVQCYGFGRGCQVTEKEWGDHEECVVVFAWSGDIWFAPKDSYSKHFCHSKESRYCHFCRGDLCNDPQKIRPCSPEGVNFPHPAPQFIQCVKGGKCSVEQRMVWGQEGQCLVEYNKDLSVSYDVKANDTEESCKNEDISKCDYCETDFCNDPQNLPACNEHATTRAPMKGRVVRPINSGHADPTPAGCAVHTHPPPGGENEEERRARPPPATAPPGCPVRQTSAHHGHDTTKAPMKGRVVKPINGNPDEESATVPTPGEGETTPEEIRTRPPPATAPPGCPVRQTGGHHEKPTTEPTLADGETTPEEVRTRPPPATAPPGCPVRQTGGHHEQATTNAPMKGRFVKPLTKALMKGRVVKPKAKAPMKGRVVKPINPAEESATEPTPADGETTPEEVWTRPPPATAPPGCPVRQTGGHHPGPATEATLIDWQTNPEEIRTRPPPATAPPGCPVRQTGGHNEQATTNAPMKGRVVKPINPDEESATEPTPEDGETTPEVRTRPPPATAPPGCPVRQTGGHHEKLTTKPTLADGETTREEIRTRPPPATAPPGCPVRQTGGHHEQTTTNPPMKGRFVKPLTKALMKGRVVKPITKEPMKGRGLKPIKKEPMKGRGVKPITKEPMKGLVVKPITKEPMKGRGVKPITKEPMKGRGVKLITKALMKGRVVKPVNLNEESATEPTLPDGETTPEEVRTRPPPATAPPGCPVRQTGGHHPGPATEATPSDGEEVRTRPPPATAPPGCPVRQTGGHHEKPATEPTPADGETTPEEVRTRPPPATAPPGCPVRQTGAHHEHDTTKAPMKGRMVKPVATGKNAKGCPVNPHTHPTHHKAKPTAPGPHETTENPDGESERPVTEPTEPAEVTEADQSK